MNSHARTGPFVPAAAMARLAALIRTGRGRTATPSMVMIDGQTVRGGRGGKTFHE
jgi:hypothetical protein